MDKDTKWIINAIDEMGETAMNGEQYWRATYTPQDEKGVKKLKSYMEEMGFETYFDEVGNLFGRIAGKSDKVILVGSHRDTVTEGGKYDGMLGVLNAIRTLGVLAKENGQPEYTVEAVAICEEESSRFPTSYLGSRHIAGELMEEELKDKDANGVALGDAIKAFGCQGAPLSKGRDDLEHFVELHIEQGGVLEHEEKQIGIVTSIVGLFTGEVYVKGQQNHAGTTPMNLRIDPVPVMNKYIAGIFDWVKPYHDDTVCTLGKIQTKPGNSNVIPHQAMFTFDIRSAKKERLAEAAEMVKKLQEELNALGEAEVELLITCNEPPVALDAEGADVLEKIAEEVGFGAMRMVSGAGHDSQVIGQKHKVNMIFVPSVKGISHDRREFTREEDIKAGFCVLKEYLKKLAW